MPIGRQQRRQCPECEALYPAHLTECPYCDRSAFADGKWVAEDHERLQAKAEAAAEETGGERLARFQEEHLCLRCVHLAVCEIGRKTTQTFGEGWLVTVGDCTQFYCDMNEEEPER